MALTSGEVVYVSMKDSFVRWLWMVFIENEIHKEEWRWDSIFSEVLMLLQGKGCPLTKDGG